MKWVCAQLHLKFEGVLKEKIYNNFTLKTRECFLSKIMIITLKLQFDINVTCGTN